MKKLFIILGFVFCGLIAKAQTNPFPSTDSLERFINRYIRNSPVEAFQNLRMNTALIGLLRYIQGSDLGSGLDTAYALNDSTLRLITFEPDTMDILIRGSGGGGGTPGGSNTQIQYNGSGSFAGDAGLAYNATTNTVTTDSIVQIKNILDSSKYRTNTIGYGRISQINFFGNSITQRQNAAPLDSAYDILIADTLKAYSQNYALSGRGVFYATQTHDSLISGPYNNAATSVMIGYNDERATSTSFRTHKKIASGIKAMFLNHFANVYISAATTGTDSTVTRSGTWTTGLDAMQWSGKTKNAASTTTINDSIVWVSQAATTIGINLIAGDGLTHIHSIVELFIDNVSQGTFNTNNIADGTALVGAANTRISYAIIVGGLSNTSHRVKLVNTENRIMYVDYFTTLDNKKPAFVIFHNINPLGGSAGAQGQGNAAIDSMVLTLPSGFPVMVIPTNTVFDPATGMDVDGVHPNNLGHKQIYHAFRTTYDTYVDRAQGSFLFDGWDFWINGRGSLRKMLTASDAWTKGDAAINTAGFVNVPYNMSYKQDGTDVLKTNKILFNTYVGPFAGISNTTAAGNTGGGYQSLTSATTGGSSTGYGYRTLELSTTATGNTAVGYFAGRNTNGSFNTYVGSTAGFANSSGTDNVGVGYLALQSNTSTWNTAVGSNAGVSITSAALNTAVGYRALASITTQGSNTAVGGNACRDCTGASNTAIGTQAAFLNTTGAQNTVVGSASFNGVVSNAFNNNTALGFQTGTTVTTGSNNIFMGYRAGDNLTTGSNNILIGYDIDLLTASTSNYMSIGNLIFGDGTFGTGTTLSSAKLGIHKTAPIWGVDIDRSVGITKDSVPTITSIGDNFLLTLDSSDNQVKKILPGSLGFATQSALNDTAAAIRSAIGAGGGITSINSETGPAFTVAGSNGLTVNTTTNTATVVLGGTLSGTTDIAGGTNGLNLGTGGSKISNFTVNASTSANINSDARIGILGNITYQAVFFNSDATHSVAANTQILQLNTSSLTTDRAITLPSASTHGQTLTITVDFAGSGNHYVLASAIADVKTGSTFTQLDFGTTYDLMVDNTLVWKLIRKY